MWRRESLGRLTLPTRHSSALRVFKEELLPALDSPSPVNSIRTRSLIIISLLFSNALHASTALILPLLSSAPARLVASRLICEAARTFGTHVRHYIKNNIAWCS